jgi:predicted small secreted protein
MGSRPARLRSRLVITALGAALVATVTAGCNPGTSASGSGRVVTLTRISTLRTMFNQADGKARLVLILSPT